MTACADGRVLGLHGAQGSWSDYDTLDELVAVLVPPAGGPVGEVIDCGTFEAGQTAGPEIEGFRCAADALERRETATLRVTLPTEEGDPVAFDYRVEDGVVHVIQDHTRDRFSDRGVGRLVCRSWTVNEDVGRAQPEDCTLAAEPSE